jgi:signal transduction histidine kinase
LTVLAAVWTVIALGAGGLVLSYAFRQNVETAFDKRLEDILIGLVSGVDAGPDESLTVATRAIDQRFSQVFSGWYWQVFDGQGVLLRSRSLWDQELADVPVRSDGGRTGYAYLQGPRDQRLRVLANDITIPRRDGVVTFLVAADVAEIETDVRRFNTLLAVSLGVLGIGLIIAIILQVTFGLRPLQRLRRDLDKVRTGREGRLGAGYPQEISPLADAMNAVLEHNDEMIGRARAHAGDLAHGLKTPLSILRGEARDIDPDKSAQIKRQVDTMNRLIDHHLARAAAAGAAKFSGKRTQVGAVASEIRDGLLHLFAGRGITISLDIPDDLYFQGEQEDLEEILGNLMENACKWARHHIGITAKAGQDGLRIVVVDDGPGLTESEASAATERGRRFDEKNAGAGLGLAIVSDIAGLYGGHFTLQRAEAGGLEATLLLPAAV